jgi:hypothetical protein
VTPAAAAVELDRLFQAWRDEITDTPMTWTLSRTDLDVFARFIAKVDSSSGPDQCYEWNAAREKAQYGMFKVDGRFRRAARWLLGFLRGVPLNRDEFALHHCDNPPCVNPRHLYVGSQSENVQDAVRRGRSRFLMIERLAAKTHCPQGHPYDEVNTYRPPSGGRYCRACSNPDIQHPEGKR